MMQTYRWGILAFILIAIVACDRVEFNEDIVTQAQDTVIFEKDENIPLIVPGQYGIERSESTVVIEKEGNGSGNSSGTDFGDGKGKLILEVLADFPPGNINPDSITLDGKKIGLKTIVDSGQQELIIKRTGYFDKKETVFVPENQVHTIRVQLSAKPRLVKFKFINAKTGKPINRAQVLMNGNEVVNGAKVKPNKINLQINKVGYRSVVDTFTLAVSLKPYVLKRKLTPAPQQRTPLNWQVFTEYPVGEEIYEPETILLDGKPAEKGIKVKPGKHRFEVRHPAHKPWIKNITVPSGLKNYTEKVTLATLPRTVYMNLNYDISPPEGLGKARAYLIPTETKRKLPLKNGMKVKPGEYELTIDMPGYESVRDMKSIDPLLRAFEINRKMISKPVVVNAKINYDIPPPGNLGPHVVTFIDKIHKVPQSIAPGGRIKPGKYNYTVKKPGYDMKGNQKEVTIAPSEQEFWIKENMEASPRQISFGTVYKGNLIDPIEIIVDGAKVTFENRFKPGRKYNLTAKFKRYQTVQKSIRIDPGRGAYVFKFNLTPK